MKKWVIGKYIRLSEADRDLKINDKKSESESITHQKALIQNFIDSDPELAVCEQYEFFDDGYSGTNFNRPAFEKMMGEIRTGRINCVIVKDFSRFGRNYIELGDYLERIFPFMGVRFISVNDQYDSRNDKGSTAGLDVAMKNIIYDYYSKDLSVKVSTAKLTKMKRGEYIGSHVPFGLMKDPKNFHKLIIDPEAAPVVRRIFDEALAGKSVTEIARGLNADKVETRAEYYRRKHPKSSNYKKASKNAGWTLTAVSLVLQQEMYYGAVVGHKRQVVIVGSNHSIQVPKDEQIIVEEMHPGIVSKEEFLKAQKIFRKRVRREKTERVYLLKGKVRCGGCGRVMSFTRRKYRDKEYRYFGCIYSRQQVESICSKEYVHEETLNEIVWNAIQIMLKAAEHVKAEAVRRKVCAASDSRNRLRKLEKLQRERKQLDVEKFTNIDKFMAGTVSQQVYLDKREEIDEKATVLDKEIKQLKTQVREAEQSADSELDKALETVDRFTGASELNREMVEALIDCVVVYDPKRIEIRWKFSGEIMSMFKD